MSEAMIRCGQGHILVEPGFGFLSTLQGGTLIRFFGLTYSTPILGHTLNFVYILPWDGEKRSKLFDKRDYRSHKIKYLGNAA